MGDRLLSSRMTDEETADYSAADAKSHCKSSFISKWHEKPSVT